MLFEISALVGIGIAICIILILISEWDEKGLPLFFIIFGTVMGYLIVFGVRAQAYNIPITDPEIWHGLLICGVMVILTMVILFIGDCIRVKISERHLWGLQRQIKRLERQITEKQERKALLKQLEGAA